MKKQEVLTLLERFPDLVDSDELIQDLFREAACEAAASTSHRPERQGPRSELAEEAREPFSNRPR